MASVLRPSLNGEVEVGPLARSIAADTLPKEEISGGNLLTRVRASARFAAWSWAAIMAIALCAIYIPVLVDSARYWRVDDNTNYCFAIFPACALMLWMERDNIAAAQRAPTAWGFAPLAFALLMESIGYLFDIQHLMLWSIAPAIAGAILLLHGPNLWRITKYPVLYLLLLGNVPGYVYMPTCIWIQHFSTVGAAALSRLQGIHLVRYDNVIVMPHMAVEVALACSGYRKLSVLLAFGLVYAFLYTGSFWKRVAIVLSAIPIAVVMNCLRISTLIVLGYRGSLALLDRWHGPSDLIATVLAFALIVAFGRSIGCRNLRDSL
jgi:exosortase